MTGTDVKRSVDVYLSTSTDEEVVLLLINEALTMIGDLSGLEEEVEYNFPSGGWADLPERTTSILSVKRDGENYSQWATSGLKIYFASQGAYVVTIRTMIPHLKSLNDKIQIHSLFDMAIISYVRGMFKMIYDDESQDGLKLLEQFKEESLKAFNTLQRMRSKG